MLADRSLTQLSSESVHPAADRHQYRDPQPNNRQSSRSLALEEKWRNWRSQQHNNKIYRVDQLGPMRAHRDWTTSQNLPVGDLGLLYICSSCAACSSCEFPTNWGLGYLWLCCEPLGPFPVPGLPHVLSSVGEDVFSLQLTWCTRVSRYSWVPPLL